MELGFGFLGTGMIAGRMAVAIAPAIGVRLVAVGSRSLFRGEEFVAGHAVGAKAIEGLEALLACPEVEAVYVATPTSAKEAAALKAIAAGKHVLVDKPFWDAASARRIAEAAAKAGVVFLDATHFVHHPRTKEVVGLELGERKALASAFYTPKLDAGNIRFDTKLEPTGAIGDLAWYCMRAVVEYLQVGVVKKVTTVAEMDECGSCVRASGVLEFDGGKSATWEAGMGVGTWIQRMSLLGETGVVEMDDFVQDYRISAAMDDARNATGYWLRQGMDSRKDVRFVETPLDREAPTAMFERFAELVRSGDAEVRRAFAEKSVRTQELVDAIWAAR
jgi:predicted dehydrogenase